MQNPDRFHILCVLRDKDDCKFISAMLDFPGVEFFSTSSVKEALIRAETEPFDLFLLETRMQDGNGFDLCRSIKEILPETPVVFYTGDAANAFKEKSFEAGATAYIVKPYFDDLIEVLREIITARLHKRAIAAKKSARGFFSHKEEFSMKTVSIGFPPSVQTYQSQR